MRLTGLFMIRNKIYIKIKLEKIIINLHNSNSNHKSKINNLIINNRSNRTN